MPTYRDRRQESQRREQERQLEARAVKPTVIDDSLSNYYDIEVIDSLKHNWNDKISTFTISLDKDFFHSIFKSKKERISHNIHKGYVSYEFNIRLRPNRKYVQGATSIIYKLVPYSLSVPQIPEVYFKTDYLYY